MSTDERNLKGSDVSLWFGTPRFSYSPLAYFILHCPGWCSFPLLCRLHMASSTSNGILPSSALTANCLIQENEIIFPKSGIESRPSSLVPVKQHHTSWLPLGSTGRGWKQETVCVLGVGYWGQEGASIWGKSHLPKGLPLQQGAVAEAFQPNQGLWHIWAWLVHYR